MRFPIALAAVAFGCCDTARPQIPEPPPPEQPTTPQQPSAPQQPTAPNPPTTGTTGAAAPPGTIAYVRRGAIRLVNADGSNDRPLWQVPNASLGYTVGGIAWRPDGTELAFSSDHEMATSWYERDIYVVSADGARLRKLTNGPALDALASFPKGTVTVRVQNLTGDAGPYFVYVLGAPAPQQVTIPAASSRALTFTNVADFGDVAQPVVVINGTNRWFGDAVADVQGGRSVDAGSLVVTAFSGIPHFGADVPFWRADGQRVGFIGSPTCNLMQVAATPPAGPSQSRLLDPAIFGATCAVDWGPTAATADQIVYVDERKFVDAGQVEFFRVAESARSAGSPLLTVGRYPRVTDIRWLPDGSGFLFARTNDLLDPAVNIHEYVFATKAERQITNFTGAFVRQFSISPDGQQIAFERVTDLKGPSDLWVVRRDGTGARLVVRDARAPAWNPRLR